MKYKLSKFSRMLTGLIAAVVLLASSGVYAGSGASVGLQHSPIAYHEDGFDGAKPLARARKYEQFTDENLTIEDKSADFSLATDNGTPATSIGLGTAPLFGTYGVIRTNSNHKSTYVALGYTSDKLAMDEVDTSDNKEENTFSYGFGVNDSSSNFEYMMSVDEENRGVSAIGMRFTSEF